MSMDSRYKNWITVWLLTISWRPEYIIFYPINDSNSGSSIFKSHFLKASVKSMSSFSRPVLNHQSLNLIHFHTIVCSVFKYLSFCNISTTLITVLQKHITFGPKRQTKPSFQIVFHLFLIDNLKTHRVRHTQNQTRLYTNGSDGIR